MGIPKVTYGCEDQEGHVGETDFLRGGLPCTVTAHFSCTSLSFQGRQKDPWPQGTFPHAHPLFLFENESLCHLPGQDTPTTSEREKGCQACAL